MLHFELGPENLEVSPGLGTFQSVIAASPWILSPSLQSVANGRIKKADIK